MPYEAPAGNFERLEFAAAHQLVKLGARKAAYLRGLGNAVRKALQRSGAVYMSVSGSLL